MKKRNLFGLFFVILSVIFLFGYSAELTGFATEQNSPSNVSISLFQVLRNTFDGSTTNFTGLNETQFRNLSAVILEKSSYGKVEFNENLDLVNMAGSDNVVNFDQDLVVSDNLIYVYNTNLSGIDKSANLSLYGITLTTPVIYHNAVVCTDCTFLSYTGEIYKFRVDSFSGPYYLREAPIAPVCGNSVVESGEGCDDGNAISGDGCSSTCQTEETGGGGGGGGGGGTTTPEVPTQGTAEYDFFVEPPFLQFKMDKGTYYQKMINVTNNGTNPLTITISVEGVQNFIFPEGLVFDLASGESKEVRLDIYVSNSREADVYVGKVHFGASQVRKEIPVVLQVNEVDALFDIRTEVLKKYVTPGGRVKANVTLVNMGDLRNFDVNLEYKVMDYDKNEYTVKKEDFAINKSYSNIFYLDLPSDIKIGNYLFYTKVSYGNVSASSYDTFVVEEVSTFAWIILVIAILILMYVIYRKYLKEKMESKFAEIKKKNIAKETEMLKKKLPTEVPKLPDEIE